MEVSEGICFPIPCYGLWGFEESLCMWGLFHTSCISGRERTIRNVTPSLTLQDKAISTLTKGYLLETHQSALSRKKSCSKYVRTSSRGYAGDAVPSDARSGLEHLKWKLLFSLPVA